MGDCWRHRLPLKWPTHKISFIASHHGLAKGGWSGLEWHEDSQGLVALERELWDSHKDTYAESFYHTAVANFLRQKTPPCGISLGESNNRSALDCLSPHTEKFTPYWGLHSEDLSVTEWLSLTGSWQTKRGRSWGTLGILLTCSQYW